MADNCKSNIEGIDREFTQDELTAYLAKGGKAKYEQIRPKLSIDEKNRERLDRVVNSIVTGKKTITEILGLLKKQTNISDRVKSDSELYIRQKIAEIKRGTKAGLEGDEKTLFDNYDNKFLNGELSFDEAMHQLGTAVESATDPIAKEKLQNIQNIFFKENQKRAERVAKESEIKRNKTFKEEVNDLRMGMSEEELTVLQSDKRILRSGTQDFIDETSYQAKNDQIRAKFDFGQYAQDLDSLLFKFQEHYENNYLNEMLNYVKDKSNLTEARISVSVALNNHLEHLLEKETEGNKIIKYKALQGENGRESQVLGTRVSLAMNALRAWNNDMLPEIAYVGIVDPNMSSDAQAIKEAMGYDITDEDLLNEEEGVEEAEDGKSQEEQTDSTGKTAGYFARKKIKKESQLIRKKKESDIKKDIEEQIKKCK